MGQTSGLLAEASGRLRPAGAADLSRSDLSGQDLRSGAYRGTALRGVDLRGTLLLATDLRGVDLGPADLLGPICATRRSRKRSWPMCSSSHNPR